MDLLATVEASPLWVVILGLAELANFLDEGLPLLEGVEFEGLGEGIEVTSVGPSLDTAAVNDVCDSCLIHFFKLINASLVELFKFSVQLVEVSGGKGEAAGHLGWYIGFLADWNQ